MDATADDWLYDSGGDDEQSPSGFSRIHDKISSWGNMMQDRAKKNGAKGFGRFAESNAAKDGKGGDGDGSAVGKARGAEGFANNVAGKTLDEAAEKVVPGGKAIMQQARKLGPAATILAIIVIFSGLLSAVGSLSSFNWVANLMDRYNVTRTAMNRREKVVQRIRLTRSRKSPAARKASFLNPDHLDVSASMKKKLAKQKIYYFGEADNMSTRFLVYQDEKTGKRYAVTADGGGEVPDKVKIPVDGDEIEVEIHNKISIDDAYGGISSFKKNLDIGTRDLRGHVAGWFDELCDLFHIRIGSSRNKQKDTPKNATEEQVRDNARNADKGMNESIKGDNSDAEEDPDKVDSETGKKKPPEKIEEDTGIDKEKTRGKNPADVEADVESSFKLKAKNILAAIGDVNQLHCAVLRVYVAFDAIMGGILKASVINFVTGYLEAVQKTQIGDAGKMEMATYELDYSKKGVTYGSSLGSDTTIDFNTTVYDGKTGKETPAYNQHSSLGGVRVSSKDPVALKFNREYTTMQSINHVAGVKGDGDIKALILAGIFGVNGKKTPAQAYKECLYTDIGSETVEIVLSFFTGGLSNIIKSIANAIYKAMKLGLVLAIVTSIFTAFIPQIAQLMTMDHTGKDSSGVDKVFAADTGAQQLMGENLQASTGDIATDETLGVFWREQQAVIAEEAELERSMKSPFDPTSKYTFLGTIVDSLLPVANTLSSPVTSISTVTGTIGSALMSLRPTANAEGEVDFALTVNHDCPNLSHIGAVGDAYCNPYFISDLSTVNDDPSDVFDAVALPQEKTDNPIDGNFIWDEEAMAKAEEEGVGYNPPINPKGELAKWVVSCAARDSGFGIVDSNVMNSVAQLDITGNATLDTAIQTGVSAIPVIGNVSDILNNFKELNAYGWATGENCIREEYKYYSRYSEDQRLLESSGLIEESAVASFLKEYYKENPIDNSYEGTIARYSGMTKDELTDTIATAQAVAWLMEYNPDDAGPMDPLPDKKDYQYESNDIIAAEFTPVLVYRNIYDDLRTKVKVA